MNYLLSRLREPSTWSGLAVIATLAGIPATTFGLIQQIVIGLLGLAAVVVPEKSASAPASTPATPADAAPLPTITGG